ncbi:MAG: serine hydrolase [Pseudomonadota bacterium]|nr:serine hydrolase [Pseudomonadota bacterium]
MTGARPPDATTLAGRIALGHRAGLLTGLHALLVRRNGETLAEAYFDGEDEDWGRPLGSVAHGPETLHDLRSVTKSVTGLLYGIALDRGLVPPPEAPLLSCFPRYPDLAADPARAGWTVAHALDMTLGTEWPETLDYTDPANAELAMERAEDRFRYVLDRPVIRPAGEAWTYSGGCSALIGRIVEDGTGRRLDAFAEEVLFAPLGVGPWAWNAGEDGTLSAASGLRLTARGLARIGEAAAAGGLWNGAQVIPAGWLARLAEPRIRTDFGMGYSGQWYLTRQPGPGGMVDILAGMGNGGQRLWVAPSLGLSAVAFCGDYNRPDMWLTPTLALTRLILPAL